MAYLGSMVLHEELNSMLRQGQRECLHLSGSIRQLKSVQAMLMMKKDTAKKELEIYVNKLSESLIDFKSEMHVTIQTELVTKVTEISHFREKYEAHIQSYMALCDETEKLVQFGKVMVSEADILKAQQLLIEFKNLQQMASEKFDINSLTKFEFYPALPVDCISSAVFGDLIRGQSSNRSQSPLFMLSARKSKSASDHGTQSGEKGETDRPVAKTDRSTQTDGLSEATEKIQQETPENRDAHVDPTRCSYTQCDNQPFISYPQTSPPGFEYVTLPYCSYDTSYTSTDPPPGFQVFQRPGGPASAYQPNRLQMNQCMITGVPYYNQTLAATPISYPVPNVPLYACNRPLSSDQGCIYKTNQQYAPLVRKSCAVPITSPDTDSKISDKKEIVEAADSNTEIKNKTELETEVKNIPLPIGPAPRGIVIDEKTEKVTNEKQESLTNEFENKYVAIDSKTVVRSNQVKQEIDEANYSGVDIDEENQKANKFEKFEKLLKKTTELLESSGIDEGLEMKRIDDSCESENWDIEDDATALKSTYTEEITDIHKQEIDQMLSNIGHDLKEKISKGQGVLSPIKPLRRPLRLPRNACSETKIKTEIDSVSPDLAAHGVFQDWKNSKEHQQVGNTQCVKSDVHSLKLNVERKESGFSEQVWDDTELKREEAFEPDILDFSASTGVNLRDAVKGHGLSKREITELNKETLQLQTSWLKGYLKQVLPEKKETALKACDENNNGTTECSLSELGKSISGVKLKRSDSVGDTEVVNAGNVAEMSTKEHNKEQTMGKSPDESAIVLEKDDPREDSPKETEGDRPQDSNKENLEEGTNTSPEANKTSDITERKTDLKHLKSTVKGYLGNHKDGKPRPKSTYARLGALQAHWLKNTPGSSIQAKFLFECSHRMHFPIGVATNSLQEIFVADTCNHCVKMFDKDGNFVKEFNAKGMHRPSAIVVNEFEHLFVKDDVSIRVFDEHCNYITDIAKDLSRPFGLVLTPGKCLLVLETDRRHPALVYISQDGIKTWRFPYSPLINAPVGSKCRFMGVSENNVIVSDLGLSQVYVTSFEGIFLKVIGSYGTGYMQFCEPSGISVDNYGNIVIGDSRNNRIQVYRYDGSYTGLVKFDERITRPSGIHLAADNKLMIVNYLTHSVKVYQLQA